MPTLRYPLRKLQFTFAVAKEPALESRMPQRQVAAAKSQCTARNLLRHFQAGNAYQSNAAPKNVHCTNCFCTHTHTPARRARDRVREGERKCRAIAHKSRPSTVDCRCGKNLTKLMCQISRRRVEPGQQRQS